MEYNINKGLILSIASDSDVYKRGEKIYKAGHIGEIGFSRQKKPEIHIIWSRISGLSIKDFNVQIFFKTNGDYSGHKCTCNSSSIWKGACTHVVATLFSLCDENSVKMETARSLNASSNITDFFEQKMAKQVENEFSITSALQRQISLEPTLYLDDETPFLRLTLYRDKQYIIKNIKDFTINISKENIVKYGKSLEFKHSIYAFDEKSQNLIKNLINFYDILKEIENFSRYFSPKQINVNLAETFLMPKKFIDDFFHIYNESEILVSLPKVTGTPFYVNICNDEIGKLFEIEHKKDRIVLKGNVNVFQYVEGEKYYYILIDDKFYKMDKERAVVLRTIQKEICSLKEPSVTFTKDSFSKFIYYVYPDLKDMGLIKNLENLLDDINFQDLDAKFYFDLEHKNKFVICKLIFNYGDNEINPLQNNANDNIRNNYKEYRIFSFLKKYGFQEDIKNGNYFLVREEQIFDFYLSGLDVAKNLGKVYVTDMFSQREIKILPKASFRMNISGNLLELDFQVGEYSHKDLLQVLSSYNIKKRYHRLNDGNFINLENENLKTFSEVISMLDLKQKDLIGNKILLPKYRILYVNKILANKDGIKLFQDEKIVNLINDLDGYNNLKFTTPKKLNKILRTYQKVGFRWLKTLSYYDFSGILADDMGLGKTLQIIALFLSEYDKNKNPNLVVTPTSLMYNWEHEIKKFAPELKIVVLSGTPAKRKELLENRQGGEIFITTYDMLKRDVENYENTEFEYLIADEAQYIKNPKTQNSIALKSIRSRVRFALTGTPIENSLQELWSIFDFIMPGYLYSSGKFSKTFETPIIKYEDKEMSIKLQKQIAPFVLRRLKSQVLKELPNKVETTLYSDMESEQHKIYFAYLMQARDELNQNISSGDFRKNHMQIFSHLTRLRQICCHPQLFIENYSGGSGKLNLTIETICSAIASGHRVLLFSQFTSMLNILMKSLKKEKISFFYLDGGTEALLRKNMVDKFNNGDRSVFLISLKAGGLGLNLIGADVVIHYDQWWNPAVMNQASDRAHRYGQKNVVQVINMVTKDTIEEKILKLQEKKKDLADSVITGGVNFITKMSESEILELFVPYPS